MKPGERAGIAGVVRRGEAMILSHDAGVSSLGFLVLRDERLFEQLSMFFGRLSVLVLRILLEFFLILSRWFAD